MTPLFFIEGGLVILLARADDTMVLPNRFTSAIDALSSAPRINSLSFHIGFWKRRAISPEAKSNALENGEEAGMSI